GRHRTDLGARLLAGLLAPLARAEEDDRRAVDDTRRVAGGVDVVDLLGVGVALERERVDGLAVEAHRHRAELLERRLKASERLERGVGARVLVVGEAGRAVVVLDLEQAAREPLLFDRAR